MPAPSGSTPSPNRDLSSTCQYTAVKHKKGARRIDFDEGMLGLLFYNSKNDQNLPFSPPTTPLLLATKYKTKYFYLYQRFRSTDILGDC